MDKQRRKESVNFLEGRIIEVLRVLLSTAFIFSLNLASLEAGDEKSEGSEKADHHDHHHDDHRHNHDNKGHKDKAHKHHEKRKHSAHVHGEAEMRLVIQDKNLKIQIQSPSYNIVGFEHQPKNDKQRQAVKRAKNTFESENLIFSFTKEAACKKTKAINLKSPLLEKVKDHHEHEYESHAHGESHKDKNKIKESEIHSDFSVTYFLRCKNIQALQSVQIKAFESFKRLKKLKIKAVTPEGQFFKTLSPSSSVFVLKK